MLTIDTLKAYGANVQEGLGRCMNNEAFYLRLVKMAAGDANFDKLDSALVAGDLTGAFEAAHALKGMLGNLSLTPVLTPVAEVTEVLRARTDTDYGSYQARIREQHQALMELCTD